MIPLTRLIIFFHQFFVDLSTVVPYRNRQLLSGTWQRVILVELDGPRQRTVHIATF